MYRLAIIALLLAAAATLGSCSALEGGPEGESPPAPAAQAEPEDEVADARFEALLDAVVGKDERALRGMFSKKALENAADIDAGTSYLIDLVQGDIVSWEREALGSGDSTYTGEPSRRLYAWYALTTTEGTYKVFFTYYYGHGSGPESDGLYVVWAYRVTDVSAQGDASASTDTPGIRTPGQ
jgi:hypothetical protein